MPTFRAFLIAVCLIPIALAAEAEGRITVVGQGSVETAPDMATISLGVTSEAETAADALSANTEATSSVLERVAAAGVEPRDIQTSGLSLGPNWAHNSSDGSSAIVGFVANNQVTIRVRDLDLLGGILDDVVQNGANVFNGLSFGLQDPEPAMDEARRNAVADALRKASLYAEAAGVTLGPIIELLESGGVMPQPMFRRESMAMDAAVPVAEGEVSVSSSVTVILEITE